MKPRILRFISVISALILVLSCVPAMTLTASAAYENTHVNTGNMAADIVAVAQTQVGYLEGSLGGTVAGSNNLQKYGQWYDNNVDYIGVQRAAWCAAFVSWCAKEAGVPSSIVYYHAYCPYGVNWFKNQGRFQYAASRGGSYVPKAGDIVYFAPAGSSTSSHIGIVRYASNGYVYTIEGNTSPQQGEYNEGGGVFAKSYALSYNRLLGYGIPAYQDNSGHRITFDSNGGTAVSAVSVKEGSCLTPPTAPTKWGFDFGGWYCNPELTDPYDFSTPVPYGFTLYAKWNEVYWGANTDLMPQNGSLITEDFQGTGENIWPYYNDDGSVTMYSGVNSDWAWPSAYMNYANSFDSANDTYIYVKKDGTAKFNAQITYMASDGAEYAVKLSELAGKGDEDFEAGYAEFFVDLGKYARDHGHIPASGNLKYTCVRYYVIGGLDSYVKLYDMRLTSLFDTEAPQINLYGITDASQVVQSGAAGSYVYDGGTLIATADTDAGYSITFEPNAYFKVTDFAHMLMDVQSEVPFNMDMTVSNNGVTTSFEFRKEFFDVFGYEEEPETLPAGNHQLDLNLSGYFYYNGGLPEDGNVSIDSVTITLCGKGNLTLCALQAAKSFNAKYFTNEVYVNDSHDGAPEAVLSSSVYTVENNTVSFDGYGTTLADFVANFDETDGVITVTDANGNPLTNTDVVGSGATVVLTVNSTIISEHTVLLKGDIDSDGNLTTADARITLASTIGMTSLNSWQSVIADFNTDGEINTADARDLLRASL